MWYAFDSLVNIRWINKEICEYHQRLRKMSFWEILDFHCIYTAKLGYRPFFEFLRTFIMIKDNMTLCRCTYSSLSNTNPCHCPEHSLLQLLLLKKTNLPERFHTVTERQWFFIMMLQTFMFQPLNSLSPWCSFNNKLS